ncbi:hypothetical protein G2W53_029535 [Senna tora]|uniref:Putative plant transposon protein domain-containing protein n=1 Tax=Senna tora TaxID=362788 RepID=A0A834T7K4_9FABA|nr:hypothetical protein G2W53_029535 [Senna tora]
MPCSHRTEVIKDRVLLINCLITKQPIDAAQIILNQLTSVATKKLPSHEQTPSAPTLAFPALITSLCKRAGVVMPPTEERSLSVASHEEIITRVPEMPSHHGLNREPVGLREIKEVELFA